MSECVVMIDNLRVSIGTPLSNLFFYDIIRYRIMLIPSYMLSFWFCKILSTFHMDVSNQEMNVVRSGSHQLLELSNLKFNHPQG